jgi:hypothetical protein
MSSTVGRVALGATTLGTSELLPSGIKKPLTRGVGAGLTLGTSEAVDALTKNLLKPPSPPEAPPQPTTESKAVQTATAEAAQRRFRARGFQSTILSQPSELKQTFGS